MKKVAFLLVLVCSSFAFGQDYQYKFRLNGVDDLASAKYATDEFRHLFEVFPTFNDSTDYFDFMSSSLVDQVTLQSVVSPAGYIVAEYYRTLIIDEQEGDENE